MWTILKCRPEETEDFIKICRRQIPEEILGDIFTFTREKMRRYEGSWHIETTEMFPGHVFFETGNIVALTDCLKRCGCLMSSVDVGKMYPVDPGEEELLRVLGGEQHHLGMSTGYIRDGIPYIIQGPLVGMEKKIRKIDRHKRLAWVEYPSCGPGASFAAGLEITSKT